MTVESTTERPILFSTEMVKALLEGRKTMTRRIVKPQPIDSIECDGNFFEGNHKGYVKVDGHPDWQRQFAYEFCPYSVEDILWVKETFAITGFSSSAKSVSGTWIANNKTFRDIKLTDDEWKKFDKWTKKHGKKSSLFMFKSLSRISLPITDIRVERVQDISEEDAKAEGAEPHRFESNVFKPFDGFKNYFIQDEESPREFRTAKESFQSLWQSINGPESWNANPWCWCVSFKTISK